MVHLLTALFTLTTTVTLSHAQTRTAATPSQAANAADHWCGTWAGKPAASDVPTAQQLPASDFTRRFFVEPQLTVPPFKPLVATEPRVQVPRIWGNNRFRVALMSYATNQPAMRIYSSSKSRWTDFHEALSKLMEECVEQGTGGAYLIPPSPGLTQATLVVYAYEVGSQFDFEMNYYMTAPYGINPAVIGQPGNVASIAVPSAAAATAAATASIAPSSQDFNYLGCYTELTSGRALNGSSSNGLNTTVTSCSQECASFEYFGVESGEECYCGDAIENGSTPVTNGCNTPCESDDTQICGGSNQLSIYQKITQTS